MSYQKTVGTLMANSHPGSYCGQDAYNDMFVTENKNGLRNASNRIVQRIRTGISIEDARLQRFNRPDFEGGGITRWILRYAD